MMWFKACPRCKRGDMNLNEDGDRLCLQCGHTQRLVADPAHAAGFANLGQTGEGSTKSMFADTARREVILAG